MRVGVWRVILNWRKWEVTLLIVKLFSCFLSPLYCGFPCRPPSLRFVYGSVSVLAWQVTDRSRLRSHCRRTSTCVASEAGSTPLDVLRATQFSCVNYERLFCGCVGNSEPRVPPGWTGRKPVRWPRSEQRVNCSSVHGCVLVGCQSSRDQWGGCVVVRSTRAKHLTTPRPVSCLPTCVDVMIRVEELCWSGRCECNFAC